MDSWGGGVLAALVVLAMVVLAQWIRLFLVMRGAPQSPPFDGVPPEPVERELAPFERAAVAELESLGFVHVRDRVDAAAWEPALTCFFAHRELPHFASLRLQGTVVAGLPVIFVSFLEDGTPVTTTNRHGWLAGTTFDPFNTVDARVDSVQAQWALHRERAAQARPLTADTAQERLEAGVAHARAESLRTGLWISGRHFQQFSFASAWRATRGLLRDRRLLSRPLDSAALRGDNAPAFLAASLAREERMRLQLRTERGLRLGLLAVTLLVSWAAWGLVFDWQFGAMLVAVVLVHEGGHALAMRALGWTNLHVFFLPMLGALATGGRPRMPAAWKDVVVLLAGPLPGLLAGLAVLASPLDARAGWHSAAIIAVAVNGLNLLPLAPLDGGQLMAIALFNRWPSVRLAFTMASAAGFLVLGWKLESPVWMVLAVLMMRGWRREAQLAGIERAMPPGVGAGELLARVCEKVCARAPKASLLHRAQLALFTLRRREVPQASVALGLAIIVALGGLGALAASPLLAIFAPSPRANHHADSRTPAQRSFDAHWRSALNASDPAVEAALAADAPRLPPQDGRLRDLEWLRTQSLPPAERASAVVRWLGGDEGHAMSAHRAAQIELAARVEAAAAVSATERVAAMRAAAAWTSTLPSRQVDLDIEARLRLAEAVDLAGDEGAARKLIDETIGYAVARDECHCRVAPALVARAWFESTHDRPLEGLRVLDGAVARALEPSQPDDLAVVRAWAYLQAGDGPGGLAMMRTALHADKLDAELRPPADNDADDDGFAPWEAPELALALHAAHRDDDARKLCSGLGSQECRFAAGTAAAATVSDGAWQARHARERAAFMRTIVNRRAPPAAPAASR